MTNSQMSIVKIEGTNTRMRKFLKDVNSRASKIVRDTSAVYVAVPAQELGWLDKVAKDVGVKRLEVQEFPANKQAPCGIFTTQLRYHTGRCKKCAALRVSKPQSGECKTVLKVEGLQDFSINGLLSLMKQRMDEALGLAQEYDTTIKAIENIPALEEQTKTLQRQVAEHREALKFFSETGK